MNVTQDTFCDAAETYGRTGVLIPGGAVLLFEERDALRFIPAEDRADFQDVRATCREMGMVHMVGTRCAECREHSVHLAEDLGVFVVVWQTNGGLCSSCLEAHQ
jgi:hypothetical protein